MKREENRKKERDGEEKWYANMNAIEAIWQTRIEESRLEYLEKYIQVTERRPKT